MARTGAIRQLVSGRDCQAAKLQNRTVIWVVSGC